MMILSEEPLMNSTERAFENKNLDAEVLTFNKTVLNILGNFIQYELIVCDDKDPLQFNTKI